LEIPEAAPRPQKSGSDERFVVRVRGGGKRQTEQRWEAIKDWAFAIAKRSTMRKARVALARRLAIIMHAMLRDGTEFVPA
jgi:hypothetical protein